MMKGIYRSVIFFCLIAFVLLLSAYKSMAQPDIRWLKHQIHTLCLPNRFGRGYVFKGSENTGKYIQKCFKEMGLKAITADSNYLQPYLFNVNTFPDTLLLSVNKSLLIPGVDYLIEASSSSFYARHLQVRNINLSNIKDSTQWLQLKNSWAKKSHKYAYLLQHADSLCKKLSIPPRKLSYDLPAGCYIIPQHGKLTWTVSTQDVESTVFYVEDTVLPKRPHTASVRVHAQYKREVKNYNVIACVPGTVPDSFIVFSAHYDHLGMMGADALFPGASDNASGTACLLSLASYFAAHPQRYTIVFIAFSGEEAGLLGSQYYVKNPLFPLSNIRFLVNMDIMGDATDGITVVNATEHPKEFSLLQQLNQENNLLPQVRSRGTAANSDHYHFSKAGVQCFFIYSNSGKGYYHDVFDKASTLSLTNVDKVLTLIITFSAALQHM